MNGSVFGNTAAVLYLCLFQLCGICVSRLFLTGETGGARLLFGSVCGSLMLHWFPILFAIFFGFTLPAHILALVLALCCGGVCFYLSRKKDCPPFGNVFSHFINNKFLFFITGMYLFFMFLVWKSFLFKDGNIYSSQATFGDMSMHLSFITSIARQGTFPPDYSILPGHLLSYPFLGDSISSTFYLLGAHIKLAYMLPMTVAAAQVFFGLYLFVSRVLSGRLRPALAWVFFFFNGGFGIIYFLKSKEEFSKIFTAFYQTPTNTSDHGIRWVNVMVDMMLPQRATLFGWAVLFPTLYLLYSAVYKGKKRYFVYAGVFAGLLPMIHTHSFLALGVICGAWLIYTLIKNMDESGLYLRAGSRFGRAMVVIGIPAMVVLQYFLIRGKKTDSKGLLYLALTVVGLTVIFVLLMIALNVKKGKGKALFYTWGVLFIIACCLALPQLCFWTFRQVGGNSMIRGHFGWINEEDNYFIFYLKNMGLVYILSVLGLLFSKKKFFVYSPALFIWIIAEFIEFQPNNYDNNKLLYPAFVLLCCCAADFFCTLIEKIKLRGVRASLTAAALVICTCSAVLTLGREIVARYELFGKGAIALARYVDENVPKDDIILTDTRHNNEIASLSGRSVVCGSPAYLYFHGAPYAKNEKLCEMMFESPESSINWFDEIGVKYVLVSDFELSSYNVDVVGLEHICEKVYDDGNRTLYKVKEINAIQE